MAIQTRNTLKGWFLRGMKPLASQFADWMDSYWHKSEMIPASRIDNLQSLLDAKVESSVSDQIQETIQDVNYEVDGKVNLKRDKRFSLPTYENASPATFFKIATVNTSCVIEIALNVNGKLYSDRISVAKGRCMWAYCLKNEDNVLWTDTNGVYVKLNYWYTGMLDARLSYAADPSEFEWSEATTAVALSQGTAQCIEAIKTTTPAAIVTTDNEDSTTVHVTDDDVDAGHKNVDMIAYKDFIVQLDSSTDGTFYYAATATEGSYYEDKIYRFSFNKNCNEFHLKMNGIEVASLEEYIYSNDIITLTPPAEDGEDWLVNITRGNIVSIDESVIITTTDEGRTDLSVQAPMFSTAATRTNVTGADAWATRWSKVAKWFSDLKPIAFTGSLSDAEGDSTHRTVTDAEKTTWNAKAAAADLTSHTGNTTVHITAAERTAWNAKQSALTFDSTPTANSSNPVKSSGIKTALDAKAAAADLTSHTGNTTVHITAAERTAWNAKQSALTFDSTPTANSSNPVKSSGIKTALDAKAAAADLTSHTGNTTVHITATERTTWNAKAESTNVLEINSSNYSTYVKNVGTESRCTIYDIPSNVNVIAINDSRVLNAGIIRLVGSEGFPNGWVIKLLNMTGDSGTIATYQSESSHANTEGTIQGFGGMNIYSYSWGQFRFIEFVYWNTKWYSPVYDYSN